MTSRVNQNAAEAAQAVITRLFQMRQLWGDAASTYFEPQQFRLALQSCIMTSRTVTFILQSNKSSFADFDTWYASYQARWNQDPIVRWARDSRNKIEKQGDLETHSQVRAEIIASYMSEGPRTDWSNVSLSASPRAIYKTIPQKYFVPHIVEHGTLLIERRWIANDLPDTEILEALGHVYGEFCTAIIDLLEANELPILPGLTKSRPDAMGALAMNRALYLSMKDGSVRGHRFFRKPMERPSKKDEARVMKRYRKGGAGWGRLKNAKTLRDIAEAYFDNARAVLKSDGCHQNMTFLFKDRFPIDMIRTDHPDRASRYVLMRDLARLARIAGADAVIMLGEAWSAKPEDLPPSGFAVEAEQRGEVLFLNAANSKGESFAMEAVFERRRFGSKKIKIIHPTEITDEGFQFLFLPFFEEWDCVDQGRLNAAFERMEEFGLQSPDVGS